MTTAMQLSDTRPTTQRALLTKEALQVDLEQRSLLKEYVQKLMVEGTDYGKIPGTDKPSLLKPGAEKLVDLFRCTPEFTLLKSDEDFDRGHGFFNYVFRVRLLNRESGAVLAEGFGSANSREGRYRWRKASRKCPACGKEAIIKGKAEYGGGWVCFKKKDGCGNTYVDDDAAITEQQSGQVENEDIATMANTVLKMAKKRALVDGSIALARCSDMFTQDVEDFADHGSNDYAPPVPPVSAPRSQSARSTQPVAAPAPAQPVAPTARFGTFKGTELHLLSVAQLGVALDEGNAALADETKKRHHASVRKAISDIGAELERREFEASDPDAAEPGANG